MRLEYFTMVDRIGTLDEAGGRIEAFATVPTASTIVAASTHSTVEARKVAPAVGAIWNQLMDIPPHRPARPHHSAPLKLAAVFRTLWTHSVNR